MAEVILKNIKKVYPNSEPKKKSKDSGEKKHNLQVTDEGFVAVKDFNLEIQDKEFIIFVGPSGCGKSTTLRMIAGLEEISGGELYIGDRLVNDVEPKDRDIAMVFQNYALYPHMTVYDNMAFGLKLRKTPKDQIDKLVHEAARILDIEHLLDRKPKALSGGQRQRVAMGRAIVRNPKVFLMDEPLSNLDAMLRVQMRSEIVRLHNELNATTIYVTHDQTEAMTMATRIVIMKLGHIQQIGTPSEIYRNPANLFVAGFIGSPAMNFFEADYKDGSIIFKNGVKIKIPSALTKDKVIPSKVIFGVRPEDIHPGDGEHAKEFPDAIVDLDVKVAELLGSEYYVHSDFANKDLVAKLEAVKPISAGDKIKVVFNLRKIHLFDIESEKCIF